MRGRQRGFGIISAIFIVVVVALIAAFMAGIGAAGRTASSYAVVGMRAHQAARSGVEWGVHQVLGNLANPDCFASPASFAIPGAAGGGFTVRVTCFETEVTEGASSYSIFDIDAVAEVGSAGADDYFRRELSASVATDL